jgi:hypothetical protein
MSSKIPLELFAYSFILKDKFSHYIPPVPVHTRYNSSFNWRHFFIFLTSALLSLGMLNSYKAGRAVQSAPKELLASAQRPSAGTASNARSRPAPSSSSSASTTSKTSSAQASRVADPNPEWIRNQSGKWIRMRNPDPDEGGQKWLTKVGNFLKVHVLKCWMASFESWRLLLFYTSVLWTFFMEA